MVLLGAGLHIGSHGLAPHARLSVRTNGPGKAVEVLASIDEQRDEIEIQRSVAARLRVGGFDYDADLTRATVELPTPFSGRGVYRRMAPANRWTGSLEVDFHGRSDVALTGDRVRPVLRHGEWQTDVRHVQARLRRPTLPRWPSTKP